MRIGLDVREFKKDTYTGLRTIFHNFLAYAEGPAKYEFVFFGNQHTDFASLPAEGEKMVMKEISTIWWDQFQLPAALKRNKIDVFFSPYIKTPVLRACTYVNTVADVIPLEAPKYKGLKAFLEKIYFFVYAFICSHRAASVVTLSKDAKEKISKVFGVNPQKIEVVYPSVDKPVESGSDEKKIEEIVRRHDLCKPYLLYVGNFKRHKNLVNLVAAFELLPDEVKNGYRLLLVGGSESEVSDMKRLIAKRGLDDRVIPVANIENKDVYVFLKNAAAFIFPSLMEGFGIPPVEAMAAGVPVAASNLAPMTEVLGNAALFFNPYDPKDISETILKLINDKDLRNQCIIRGHERVLLFDAKSMSKNMIYFLEVVGKEKTLLISSEFPPVKGGIATHIFNLWNRISKKDIVILTAKTKEKGIDNYDKGFDILRGMYPLGGDICSRTIRTIMIIYYAWRLSCLRNIKRLHCAQFISAGLAGLILKRLKGISYVIYAYSADVLEFSKNFVTQWIMQKVFRGSEHIIANSIFTKSIIIEHKLAAEEKITVSTPGVDTVLFNPEKGEDNIKKIYGIPDDCKVLLTVSRLVPRKGHRDVIESLPSILAEYPDFVYMIIGDGGERKRLESLVKEKGVEKNVVFTGKIPAERLTFFYNACDIFIMIPHYLKKTGDVEGFGIVFLEASACCKPVIAGNTGGVSEAVINSETGIIVEPGNIDQIRAAILRLLRDEDLAKKLGNKGLLRVRKEFNWDSRVEELRKYI